MIPEYESKIAFRLSREERQKIEALVKAGKFRNTSNLIRAALKEFLSKQGA